MHRDYSFPISPYPIQVDFMNTLYDCLSNCKGGIFESPTGTGKSLSIICGSLTFLTDYCSEKLRDSDFSPSISEKRFKPDYSGMSIPALKHEISKANPQTPDPTASVKILYLSRTHSQLDQTVSELKRTKWNTSEKIRLLRLGSRSQLCVNQEVLRNKGFIDFKCKELTKSVSSDPEIVISDPEWNSKRDSRSFDYRIKTNENQSGRVCEYFDNQTMMKEYLVNNVCDIEDLVRAGSRIMGCPYFATRASVKNADFILAPYASVLKKHNRHAIGIDLAECFVIIDEAHNLIEAITDLHSASITKRQIDMCNVMVKAYYDIYLHKMLPRKLAFVRTAIKIIENLLEYFRAYEDTFQKVDNREDFLRNLELQDIEFIYLWDFFEEDQLAAKIYECCESTKLSVKPDLNALKQLADFILALNEYDGKILFSKIPDSTDTNLKFLLLNPFNKFQKFLSESRCVILAGGTLTPSKEFFKLFSGIPPHKFKQFSCGHVIPQENLLVTTISRSPSNQEFRFMYDNRENIELLQELGEVLLSISCVVPNGMVVFVPSYNFLKKIQTTFAREINKKLSMRKKVFYDSKDETALKEYAEAAERGGAVLFAVVRGTLSEGINFSDKLGRCVVMVGMPYLNRNDLQVAVKMEYHDLRSYGYSGREFYENACHIAVNQSIGRAIRHARDFAAIILIDSRHVASKKRRPAWMLRSYVESESHDILLGMIRKFFRSKINTTQEGNVVK